jgi:hypothetical protein
MTFKVGDFVRLKQGKIRTSEGLRYLGNNKHKIIDIRGSGENVYALIQLKHMRFGVFFEDLVKVPFTRKIVDILNEV